MSVSILKALPGKLDIKGTHLVFSFFEMQPQCPNRKYIQKYHNVHFTFLIQTILQKCYCRFLCFFNAIFLLMFIFFNFCQYRGSSSEYASKGIGVQSVFNVQSHSGYSLSSFNTGSSPSLYMLPPHKREHNISVFSSTASSFFFGAGAAPFPGSKRLPSDSNVHTSR